MRLFACTMLLPLLFFPQDPHSPVTFPIPADMRETWPGAKLSDAEKQLLQRAVAPELYDEDEDSRSGKKYSFDSLDTADIALGSLGKGVIVLMSGSSLCGNGGWPFFCYVPREQGDPKIFWEKKMGARGSALSRGKSQTPNPVSSFP